MALSPLQIAQFHSDGFLVLPNFMTPDECAQLKARARQIILDHDTQELGNGLFETAKDDIYSQTNGAKPSRDQYFLSSGFAKKVFFEPSAKFDENKKFLGSEEDKLGAVNKIGHALHDYEIDEVFARFTRQDKIKAVACSLLKQPLIPQSMVIVKAPKVGGEVSWHRDSTFLMTEPEDTCIGLWWPLEDATKQNGCLWAIPRSHLHPETKKPIHLKKRFVRNVNDPMDPSNDTTEMRSIECEEDFCFDENTAVPLECSAGAMVIIHGSLLHKSEKNLSPQSRMAYAIHLIEGESCTWSDKNWLQRGPQSRYPTTPAFTGF